MIEIISQEIEKTLKLLNISFSDSIEVISSKSKENGDYSSNVALKLSKKLNKNVMEIANLLAINIKHPNILKIEVKEPGFINFFLDKKYLFANVINIINLGDDYGRQTFGNQQKINYEFVSGNPTGILHFGNARGGAYGDNMARILSFCNFDVTKEYYINDAGNQVKNLGLSIQARYLEQCGKESIFPEDGYHGNEITDLAKKIYNENKDKYIDSELDFFINFGIKAFLAQIIEDLRLYRVEYDIFTSEKDIYIKYPLDGVINKLRDNGYAYSEEGAIWFKSSLLFDDKDHVLVKSDGTYSYLVPDIAYHIDKISRGYDSLVVVLGTDHHGYVNRIKSSLKALNYNPEILNIKLLQLVKLIQDGEELKMSKRTGNAISLRALIDQIGVNAARYLFASKSLDTQMEIDLDLAVKQSNENPVYYINYAYARICTILSKYEKLNKIDNFSLINSNEKFYDVLEAIYNFPKVIKDAANKGFPHLITNYIYNLASSFHYLYNEYRFVNENDEITIENLNVLLAIKITMKNALNLIGVIPEEKM